MRTDSIFETLACIDVATLSVQEVDELFNACLMSSIVETDDAQKVIAQLEGLYVQEVNNMIYKLKNI